MLSTPAVTFVVALLLASYLTVLCFTPPNPKPDRDRTWKRDRVGIWVSTRAATVRKIVFAGIGVFYSSVVLGSPALYGSSLCPCATTDTVNPRLLGWNTYTFTCLSLIICVGTPLRLVAFSGLGRNFTFQLARPDKLVTTGIYRYVQHPSYVGQVFVLGMNLLLFFRWDGPLACWIPESVRAALDGWGYVVYGVVFVFVVRKAVQRVLDEEEMLRETFGKEWEEWHRSTKRFIPGIV